jgi:hypothetical protein
MMAVKTVASLLVALAVLTTASGALAKRTGDDVQAPRTHGGEDIQAP